MIGNTLKALLEARGVTAGELARDIGLSAQTLYSIIDRDSKKVDLQVLLDICRALEVPLEYFYEGRGPELPSAEEWELVRGYRRLDGHGRRLTRLVVSAEGERVAAPEEAPPAAGGGRIIPLYLTAAAAGYASPVVEEDYEDYEAPPGCRADFAVRIEGDSMEPYIADGSVALVKRGEVIRDGDVGLFFADTGMVVKQYCQDYVGDVRLFSLNRRRADADIYFPAGSSAPLCCFGKVLLDKTPPLPSP